MPSRPTQGSVLIALQGGKGSDPAGPSQQGYEFIHREAGVPDEGAEDANTEFFVLGDGKVDWQALFGEDGMTSDLTAINPACLLEGCDGLLA